MNYKVLIVEDDPMVAMINEQYVLKNPSFTVVGTCRNGAEALQFLESNPVDLILLDVFMPVMNGTETLKKIRENKIDSEVIMVTAANDTATIEDTIHLGVLDYLIKPFAYERFNISLEKFLAQKQMLGQNSVIDQSSLDKLISNNQKSESSPTPKLPKGIQPKTLTLIQDFFKTNNSWNTVDMIAEELGISIVTVRNYLNYLVNEKQITEDINYSTGGRPSMLYKSNHPHL